ncbi:MAG: hypothetical protein C4316_00470 [Chloroflexota bacterium]
MGPGVGSSTDPEAFPGARLRSRWRWTWVQGTPWAPVAWLKPLIKANGVPVIVTDRSEAGERAKPVLYV